MSEIGETFAALRKMKQAKRADNRESGLETLLQLGVYFDVRNGGAHLIVRKGGAVIDFWPGTGLWIQQKSPARGRGIRSLINHWETLP